MELNRLQYRTRFHVNRVDNDSFLGDQETNEALTNMTREALPRLDNYRNIMSIQAIHRPTLDELHHTTDDIEASSTNILPQNDVQMPDRRVKFGWIQGVLMRCLLNIWGVMLFLRLSWVVAQAGIGQALLLILTTTAVTTITSLSMSAISTNGLVKGGGTYYMISRSLGPEFGGSIGLIFSLANAVACSMYVVGFSESLIDILRPDEKCIIDCAEWDVRIISCITITMLLLIVMIGMEWETKAQLALLVILLIALVDFVIGTFVGPKNREEYARGFIGYSAELFMENFPPDYRVHDGVRHNFFSIFAIFFPAATGILAGANISGDLKDPQHAIPKGTLWAILLTTLSYLIMAMMIGATVMRDASGFITSTIQTRISPNTETIPSFNYSAMKNSANENSNNFGNAEDIYSASINCTGSCQYGTHNSFQVIKLVSAFGPIINAGCFAATLSSALASLVSAPKVFHALCQDHLYPGMVWFNAEGGKEPIKGYFLTFAIAIGFILIGNLNTIAPLISNFFLAAYTLINFSTFHASLAKPIGWRPTFKYYNMWLSLVGAIVCLTVMFLISWWTAVLTLLAVVVLYILVACKKPDVNWGSTTQAQTYNNALTAIQQLDGIEEHVKNYRPQILVLSGIPEVRPFLIKFAHHITKSRSLLMCADIVENPLSHKTRAAMLMESRAWLRNNKIKGFCAIIDDTNFQDGATSLLQTVGVGKLRPNILLMGYKQNWAECLRKSLTMYFNVMHKALDMHIAVVILRSCEHLHLCATLNDTPDLKDSLSEAICGSRCLSQLNSGSSTCNMTMPGSPQALTSRIKNVKPHMNIMKKFENMMSSITNVEKNEKKGTIDVWWLYDDGGLTLLLPYIISTRKNWSRIKLRIFVLANKNSELEYEQRSMASLLSRFRIDYSCLQVIPSISKTPEPETKKFFDRLIANFSSTPNSHDAHDGDLTITQSELTAMNEKTNRHLRLRELLIANSMAADLIVMTLPMPRKGAVSAPLYMAWLETLTRGMPQFLLVRGNHTSVLTFYS